MDEKTAALRDIFVDVTEEETVTEHQADERGSLTGDDRDVEAQLGEVVADMREALAFETELDDESLVRVVRGFYEGESDTEIAEALDASRSAVVRARLDLHLLRECDTDAPFDLAALRERLDADDPVDEIAADLDVSPSTVRRYARVVRVRDRARRVSDRYRSAFESAFTDADLVTSMTDDVTEDGLDDALDGMETDVSF